MPAATVARVDSASREATAPRGHRRRRGRHRRNTARPPPPLGTVRSDSHRSDRATPRHVRWIGEAMRQDADVGDESIELLWSSPSQEPLASQHALQLVVQPRTRHHRDGTRSDELDDAPWNTVCDRSGHQNVRIDHDPERLSQGRPSAVGRPERCQFLGRDQRGRLGSRLVRSRIRASQPSSPPDDVRWIDATL